MLLVDGALVLSDIVQLFLGNLLFHGVFPEVVFTAVVPFRGVCHHPWLFFPVRRYLG